MGRGAAGEMAARLWSAPHCWGREGEGGGGSRRAGQPSGRAWPDTYFYIFHVSYFTPKCDKQKGSGRQQALFSLVLFFPGSLAVKGAEKSSCGGWREWGIRVGVILG